MTKIFSSDSIGSNAKKIFASVAIVFLLAIGIGTGIYLETSSKEVSTPTRIHLIGYSQDEKSITVEFNEIASPIKHIRLTKVPETLDLLALRKEATLAKTYEKKVSVPLANEPIEGEYSIILFLGDNYVELIRQSARWLEQTFNFKRAGGYTILGRRTISTDGSIAWSGPLKLVGRPQAVSIKPIQISDFKEINLATGLLHALWAQPIQQGPSNKSYTEFLELPFEEKMRRVQTGEFAVMCQGFRDLFFHASTAIANLEVRMIDAVNYAPNLKDLVSYSHATTEVWVRSLKKWVLFDPWLGIIVIKDGMPIGSEELSKANNTHEISIYPVIKSVPRMYRQGDGELIVNSFYPESVKVSQFSCERLGCSPGYAEYFKNYNVREATFE
jgi:hypothetical protein